MIKLHELSNFLEMICPLELAEDWDNVGLILGDRNSNLTNVMTCLTITLNVVEEAIQNKTDLIVSHHPFPFHASKKWTTDSLNGKILLSLIESKIAVYSPHTAHDSALFGVNRQIAELLNLDNIRPLFPYKQKSSELIAEISMLSGIKQFSEKGTQNLPCSSSQANFPLGTGRIGNLNTPLFLADFVFFVKQKLNVSTIQWVGKEDQMIQTVAVGCGSAAEFIDQAIEAKADAFLVGEARFHDYLTAEQNGLGLILPGHFASEQFAMKTLADRIRAHFPSLNVWLSKSERDPVHFC
ncbi:MAG: Nif3-like dinuclear metal center hexameric protein [Planctomycetia bacterium]|nr:Nif3-like dinuclear metal center hexameric protein [Planctomycetia bacterium]